MARGVAAHVNERMAELGLEGRIDHRSYADQGIELETAAQDRAGSVAQAGAGA
ncbi:MobA/MobL family protein [Sphingomonas sp. LK11]|uniref:MobA/MobL family protein n=1 Tax=Sphingomonas sp. LK11 TaxID=1390395 RepID=UPI003FA7975D